MLEKGMKKEFKETILIGDIKENSHIIIYKDKDKETYSIKILHQPEKLENIKKTYSNCQILSINGMNFDTQELNPENSS